MKLTLLVSWTLEKSLRNSNFEIKIFNFLQCVFAVLIAAVSAYPRPQSPIARDGAPSYGKQPDGYFQYVNVPAHKEYEFGWNRGHPNHYISRYEQSKDHRFRTRVRWGDSYDGYGESYWEYNHGPDKYEAAPYKEEPKPYVPAPPSYVA